MEKNETKDTKQTIKTFVEACNALGDKHPFVLQWAAIESAFCDDKDANDIRAYLKLRIVVAALNDGWKPQYSVNEFRYIPWFYIYSKEEWEKLDDDKKKRGRMFGGRAYHYGTVFGGMSCIGADISSANTYGYHPTVFAFKDQDTAYYCGTQFIDLWRHYVVSCM